MIVAWFPGLIIGTIAQRAMERNVERYKQAHPLPESIEDVRNGEDAERGMDDSVPVAAR